LCVCVCVWGTTKTNPSIGRGKY